MDRRDVSPRSPGRLLLWAGALVWVGCFEGGESHLDLIETPASCASAEDPASCSAATGCRWLHPGCGDGEPPAVELCAPDFHCEKDSECPDGTVCRTVVVDPCGPPPDDPDVSTCGACGAHVERCVPPSAVNEEPDCHGAGTPDACETKSDCFWFVPGCDADPDGPPEGCYPSPGCAAEDDVCPQGLTCQPAVHDPCWDSDCRACGADIDLCAA